MDRTLLPFVEKLLTRTLLSNDEQDAILALGGRPERMEAHKNFVLLGDDLHSTCFVLEGLCARFKLATEERRQITALYIPGDMPDLYSAFAAPATSSIQALTSAVIIRVPHTKLHPLMARYPGVSEAFTRYLIADAAISNEWVANVGGRDAKGAVAHLFCEMAVRKLEAKGNEFSFHFPMTQTQIGEATGLSAVHVNRTFTALRDAKIVSVEKSVVHVLDWAALQRAGGFDGHYLASKGAMRIAAYPMAAGPS